MKGYTSNIPENCGCARLESVNASYKDLAQVCGTLRGKRADWAVEFLEQASKGEVPVFFRRHNKRLGHRRELGGKKGRYPQKAAKIVLKLLKSAIANCKVKGLSGDYKIYSACANKKEIYPRMAPKGRMARSFLETSRVELVLQGSEVPKGVEVTPPPKPDAKKAEKPAAKKEAPKPEPKKEAPKPEVKKEAKKEEAKPETKKEPPKENLKQEGQDHSQHKHAGEAKSKKEMPHQHGENDKR